MIKYENYKDKLCFWKCLAYHYDKPKDHRDIKKRVKKLFNNFYNQDIKTYDDITKIYKGIEYVEYYKADYEDENKLSDEIEKVENHFKININVYTNDECTKEINEKTGEKEKNYIVEIDRRSMLKYDDTLNLMRYKNHFMYIKDLNQIRHCYRCKKCSKIFKNMEACNRHEKKCDELIRHTFVGGEYKASKSIFEKVLEKIDHNIGKIDPEGHFKAIGELSHFYPYYCAYDFEAMVKPLNSDDNENKLKITCEHVPVSVSIFSNVPGFDIEPIFLCNDNPDLLINDFTNQLHIIAQKAEELNEFEYYNFSELINILISDAEAELAEVEEEIQEDDYLTGKVNYLESLRDQFSRWLSVLPIISFNGSKYDINLMKQYLFKSLDILNENVQFSIKKANSYMSITTDHLQFLDIRSYLAPNYSYDAFIKAYKCNLEKGFFPYDWFNDYEKINNTELPPHDAFFNKMKNQNISEDEYQVCVNAWKNNKMTTFKDFLKWYNNLDVLPFIEALGKMKTFYENKNLDIFKDGVSLPGLVLKYLIRSTSATFHLFDEKDQIIKIDEDDEPMKRNNLFYLLKDSIVGGPSIIFNRYHESGKTYIRNGKKICKKIIGYDANALYLWAIAQEMPTGKHEHIKKYDLNELKDDILNDKVFGFVQVDIETPEHLKDHFSEMTPIFKNAKIKFEDIGEYMQNYHKENDIKFIEGNKLIGSYFGKRILLYTPLLKWYLQHGLEITKFHRLIAYEGTRCFKKFADEVSDARRAGDVNKDFELIAETMKLFGNSAYGKTITNKENFSSTSYANEDNITKKINNPHFKDLEKLFGDTYEVSSTKREIKMDLPLQIGVAVYHLAKLRMLQFYYDFIDKYIDRSDFELTEMDTDSNYFAFSEDSIDKLIKPHMREEYEKDKYNFLPSESQELHPTFNVEGTRFSYKAYEKRTPGLFKVETMKDKMVSLCSKMYCASDESEENIKFSCKGIQKAGNDMCFKNLKMYC